MTTATTLPNRRGPVNFGLRGMLVIVAGLGAVFAAWRFFQENRDAERAIVTQRRRELDSPEPKVRVLAARTLGDVRSDDARMAVQALVSTLHDADAQVREAAATSLHRLFNPWSTRDGLVGDATETGEALIRRLEDPEPAVRKAAARTLATMATPSRAFRPKGSGPAPTLGPDPTRAVPALEVIARDPDPKVREAALSALSLVIVDRDEACRRLLAALVDEPEPAVRLQLLQYLSWPRDLAVNTPEATRLLIGILGDPDPNVRSSAAWLLIRVSTPPDEQDRADLIARFHQADDEPDEGPESFRVLLARLVIQFVADPEVIRPLVQDANPAVRSMARGVLGMPDDEVSPGGGPQ